MEGLGFNRLMAMAATLALVLGASMARAQGGNSCYDDCIMDCFDSRVPNCYARCIAVHHCHPSSSSSLGHCELGCKITRCTGLRSDAKELEFCQKACLKDCSAIYPDH